MKHLSAAIAALSVIADLPCQRHRPTAAPAELVERLRSGDVSEIVDAVADVSRWTCTPEDVLDVARARLLELDPTSTRSPSLFGGGHSSSDPRRPALVALRSLLASAAPFAPELRSASMPPRAEGAKGALEMLRDVACMGPLEPGDRAHWVELMALAHPSPRQQQEALTALALAAERAPHVVEILRGAVRSEHRCVVATARSILRRWGVAITAADAATPRGVAVSKP